MRKSELNLIVALLLLASPCLASQNSSGFLIGKNKPKLPEGIPHRVGCINFDGPSTFEITDKFCRGLSTLGFEVYERKHFNEIAEEIKLQQSGFMSTDTVKELGKQLGLEAVFVGTISSDPNSSAKDMYISVRMAEVQTSKIIWSGGNYTVSELLNSLSSDIKHFSSGESLEDSSAATSHSQNLPSRGEVASAKVSNPSNQSNKSTNAQEIVDYFRTLSPGTKVSIETVNNQHLNLYFDTFDSKNPRLIWFCKDKPPCLFGNAAFWSGRIRSATKEISK